LTPWFLLWGPLVTDARVARNRDGFVMLTTLWVMSIASIVAMSAVVVGRHAVAEGSARVELERARWSALACERRALAAVDDILEQAPTFDAAAHTWRTLGRPLLASPLVAGCNLALEAAGTRLDINSASSEMIVNLLGAIGRSDDAAQMADALADWLDGDDNASPAGAERQWYESVKQIPPRNGPLADLAELRRVRGFEQANEMDSVVSVDPGRVSLATAPVSVLMAVPGITRETAERIVELQAAGTPVNELLAVTGSISRTSIDALAARFPDAVRATTPDPDAWLVRVRVSRGLPAVSVLLDWRIIRIGHRCAVARTKSVL
jgi:type II secretory pathway component PulK